MKLLNACLCALVLSCTLSCEKDDDKACQGIDCLPPITQTGAGTFGCLVNGEPFVDNSGSFNCFYQLVDGEYYFGIQSNKNKYGLSVIGLGSNMANIITNTPIELNEDQPSNFYGGVNLDNLEGSLRTRSISDGFITFIEFTIIDPSSGTVYEITDGRFDAIFTR